MTVHPLNGASTGSVTKVLGPTEGTDYSGGVGSPQILQAPESDDIQDRILFTGWPSSGGSNRSLFVGEINNALQVSNVKKIVDSAVFGRVDQGFGVYDPVNSEWIIGMGRNTGAEFHIKTFSKDFSTETSDTTISKSGKDAGANVFSNQKGGLMLSWVDSTNSDVRIGKVQSDITARPISSSLNGEKFVQLGTKYNEIDVNNIIYGVSGLTILGEYFDSDHEQWALRPSFVGNSDILPWANTALTSTQPLIQASVPSGSDNYGHPHYTTALGRPLMFFCWFKNLHVGYNTHEIWAMEPDYNVLNSQDWFPLRGRVIKGGSGPSDPFHTHGADTMTLWVDAGGNTGNVFVREAMSSQTVLDGAYSEQSLSASTGRNKFVVDDPMHAVEIATDFGTNGVDVMLR